MQFGQELASVTSIENQYVHIYDQFGYDDIKMILSRCGKPEFIFSDHYTLYNHDLVNVVGSALFAERSARIQQNSKYAADYKTEFTFNFSCNKKQINRYLLIKLVEIFNLQNYTYTWSGAGQSFDLAQIIQELDYINFDDGEFKSKLLAGICKIPPRWIEFKQPLLIHPVETSSIVNYGGNVWSWNNGLNDMYERSAISLIAESIKFEKAAIFTEKTVYSVMGCTLPIWVGGYKQASEWKRIGFDTFDDIIDHSYQEYDTLFERCYYAFKNNLKLLQDCNLAVRTRHSVLNRLLENKRNLVSILTNFNNAILEDAPDDFQKLFRPTLAKFRQ